MKADRRVLLELSPQRFKRGPDIAAHLDIPAHRVGAICGRFHRLGLVVHDPDQGYRLTERGREARGEIA